jgi:ubiquinone/menaquinone biosynthesis C-methylase UbiE
MAPSLLVSVLVAAGLSVQAPEQAPRVFLKPAEQKKDVPYVPTPPAVVDAMIALAEVKKGDVVYDLGCGDGRIVIAAVRIAGVRGVCVDIDPERIADSREQARAAGVEQRIRFVRGDLFAVPIADATVVMMYLLPDVNLRLRPRLQRELRPGTRVVSHAFSMGDWKAAKQIDVGVPPDDRPVYLWVIEGRRRARARAPAVAPAVLRYKDPEWRRQASGARAPGQPGEEQSMRSNRAAVASLSVVVSLSLVPGAMPAPVKDVPYVPTPPEVVQRMIQLAGVKSGDVLYDLGCGDGRIVIAAVKMPGVRGVCVDIDPERIAESKRNAETAGVSDRIRFVEGDLFKVPFSDATVMTLYLMPDVNMRLRPRLLGELKPGTRIVSHAFDMGDWVPEERVTVDLQPQTYVLYRWTIPEKKATRR